MMNFPHRISSTRMAGRRLVLAALLSLYAACLSPAYADKAELALSGGKDSDVALTRAAVVSTSDEAAAAEAKAIAVATAVADAAPLPKAAESGNTSSELCRGAYLRTEIRNTEKSFEILPCLSIDSEDNQPVLILQKCQITSLTEVRIYESMLRVFVKDEDGRGYFDYRKLPDSPWEGESNVRRTETVDGVIANARVIVDDIPCHTDDKGKVIADHGRLDLLAFFDAIDCRLQTILIRCPGLPAKSFSIYRTMPQRAAFDEKRLEEPPEQDVLVAYKLDFRQPNTKPEQEGLVCQVILPEDFAYATAGKPFPVRVLVKNNGTADTSCLIARLFSRIEGVDGKLFYFGAVKAGESKEFTRYLTIPNAVRTGKVYAELHFSDSWSAIKLAESLSFTVLHQD